MMYHSSIQKPEILFRRALVNQISHFICELIEDQIVFW